MADERTNEPGKAEYAAPEVESLGSAEELAKGNEGSQTDSTTTTPV
jgi:hypothetical protein